MCSMHQLNISQAGVLALVLTNSLIKESVTPLLNVLNDLPLSASVSPDQSGSGNTHFTWLYEQFNELMSVPVTKGANLLTANART